MTHVKRSYSKLKSELSISNDLSGLIRVTKTSVPKLAIIEVDSNSVWATLILVKLLRSRL